MEPYNRRSVMASLYSLTFVDHGKQGRQHAGNMLSPLRTTGASIMQSPRTPVEAVAAPQDVTANTVGNAVKDGKDALKDSNCSKSKISVLKDALKDGKDAGKHVPVDDVLKFYSMKKQEKYQDANNISANTPAAGIQTIFLPIRTYSDTTKHKRTPRVDASSDAERRVEVAKHFRDCQGPQQQRAVTKQYSNLGSDSVPKSSAKQYVINSKLGPLGNVYIGGKRGMIPPELASLGEQPTGHAGHLKHGNLLPSEYHKVGEYGSYGSIRQNIG